MLNIVTVNAGNYQGRGVEYVNTLFDCIRRNLAEGFRGKFVVFTDQPEGYDGAHEVRPLPVAGLQGWWNKLALFKPGVFQDGDRVLYFDLSAVPTGRLDEIAGYEGNFAILRDFYRPDGLQSSVMAWRVPYMSGPEGIWAQWVMSGKPEVDGGDQAWIEECFSRHGVPPDILQERFPGLFVSYKVSGRQAPAKASVCVFHGQPKPHECDGWVRDVWKVGGLTRAELDVVCNTEREVYMANVRENCKRDLPWLDFAPAHDRQVAIVGGSPSVKNAVSELRYRQSLGQEIWALNGSFAWLKENGIFPTAHFIIDARPENFAFLRPDAHVRYYLASQCHPSLFSRLRACNVTVFHLLTDGMEEYLTAFQTDKPTHLIGGGTTVGMKALLVAHEIGFRKIHLYGMDSSYTDDEHHAYAQPMNDAERTVDAVCMDRKFKCAPWMVTQATDFIALSEHIIRDGTVITVNGDGLLPYVAREMMATPTILPADVRAHEVLKRINGNSVGAEVGVFGGDMSSSLLLKPDLTLYMVDSWKGNGEGYKGDSGDFHATLSQEDQDRYYERTQEMVRFAGDRARIIRKDSRDAAAEMPDASLDFVFIDADHSYEGSKADITAWAPKVKPGGILSGHDYGNTKFPKFGVTRSVTEFSKATGWPVELGENFTWFIKIPEAA
jgi:hypothetical protein